MTEKSNRTFRGAISTNLPPTSAGWFKYAKNESMMLSEQFLMNASAEKVMNSEKFHVNGRNILKIAIIAFYCLPHGNF